MGEPLAFQSDLETVLLRPLTPEETPHLLDMIEVASAKLRQACPFNIDARIAVGDDSPYAPLALDRKIVANVVAGIVARYLGNPEGAVTKTDAQTVGPYSTSASRSFVNRYDKTGSDVRGRIAITPADIDELRPATKTRVPQSIQLTPTRAMEPAVGFWPSGYNSPLDPVTGDPRFGLPVRDQLTGALQDFFYDDDGNPTMAYTPPSMNLTQISGAVVPVSASGTLQLGRETEVTGSAAVSLAFSATVNGSTAGVKVSETYTGSGVTVTGTFLGGATSFTMVAGQENKFTWNGAAAEIS